MSLLMLADETITKICTYLPVKDLYSLRQTCRRLNYIIEERQRQVVKIDPYLIVTNQRSEIFSSRNTRKLKNFEKLRISHNWRKGIYKEKAFLKTTTNYIPFINVTRDHLWHSRGEVITRYKRSRRYIKKPDVVYKGEKNTDITQFQVKGQCIIGGLTDGNVCFSVNGEFKNLNTYRCQNMCINSVDISEKGSIFITGSRDGYLGIWNINNHTDVSNNIRMGLQDLIWKTVLNDYGQLAVALAANERPDPLIVYNLEDFKHRINFRFNYEQSGGIRDIKWIDSNTLWTCGYNSCLQRWDIRTQECVQQIFDPCGSHLYCLDFDGNNTILCGTNLHGRVTLFDARQDKPIQMYYMQSCRNTSTYNSSPVYSLAFDSEFLYVATSRALNVLDFTTYSNEARDYEYFFHF